jgi:hypothetical protein
MRADRRSAEAVARTIVYEACDFCNFVYGDARLARGVSAGALSADRQSLRQGAAAMPGLPGP